MRSIAKYAHTLILFAACGAPLVGGCSDDSRPAPESADTTATEYVVSPGGPTRLMQAIVAQDGWTFVCLHGDGLSETGVSSTSAWQDRIRRAITAWIDAARPASTLPLRTSGRITFGCGGHSADVEVHASATGFDNAGSTREYVRDGKMHLTAKHPDYAVVLHEFGHVFGLGDTYVENVWSCQPYQPRSVMCGEDGIPNTILEDDVLGMQKLFCVAHAQQCAIKFGWTAPYSHGGDLTSAPTVTSTGPGILDVFMRDRNNTLVQKTFDGTRWQGFYSHGGSLGSAPSCISRSIDTLDCFMMGSDGTLVQKTFDGTRWQGFYSHGGRITSAPSVVSTGPGRLDVFMRGANNALVQKTFDGTRWQDFYSLGGVLGSGPACVSKAPNTVDCFMMGANGSLVQKSNGGAGWTDFYSHGGVLGSAPTVASSGPGILDVFMADASGALVQKSFNGSRWSDFYSHGAQLGSAPACTSRSLGALDCFFRGTSGALVQMSFRR